MTKSELVSSIRQLILRQHPTQDSLKIAHPAIVEAEIAKAYTSLLKTFYANEINLMNADLDFYAKKYTKTIKTDSEGFSYVDLPVKVIELKSNLGIRYVKPKGGDASFIRIRENELDTIRNLDVFCCSKNVYYYIDGARIVIVKSLAEHDIIEQVYVKLLPLFGEFGDDDNIEFPQGEFSAMQMILQTMGYRQTDNINDDVR